MKMVKSVYTKILENVPDHMPETGGMLGGQNGIVTKIVFDDGKEDDFRKCHNPRKSCSFRLLCCRIKKSYHIVAIQTEAI